MPFPTPDDDDAPSDPYVDIEFGIAALFTAGAFLAMLFAAIGYLFDQGGGEAGVTWLVFAIASAGVVAMMADHLIDARP